jgi:HD-GYP domain-containing protein (c-di-GMP phosphodiesterase class II)
MRCESSHRLPVELGDYVEAFELALLEGPADFRTFLPDPEDALYQPVLRELIRVDLEHGWQRGQPRRLEEYRYLCPEIFADSVGLQEIAFEEYRLRRQAGEAVSPAEYQQRFGVNTGNWVRPQPPAAAPQRKGPKADRGRAARVQALRLDEPATEPVSRRKLDTVLSEILDGNRSHTHQAAWLILEQLLGNLQSCERTADQVRLVLEAVRESLDADLAFWYAGASDEVVDMIGDVNLPPSWCRAFVRRMLAATPGVEGHLLRSTLPPFASGGDPAPQSLVMIQVSKTRPTWLVALSFDAERNFGSTDLRIMGLAKRMLLSQRHHVQTSESLKETLFGLVHCLTIVIDSRDPYTCGHSERVARIAVRLGQEMGLPLPLISDIYLAGLLHDVGKIGVEDSILRKDGKLTPEEYEQIKAHVLIGDRIVSTIKQFESLRPGVRHHHERWDGKGYPDGLAGDAIPLMARVLAVADSCDAMMSARPYRPGMATTRIDAIMSEGAGSQWDPQVVNAFMRCRAELYPICQQGIGSSVRVAVEQALQAVENGSLRGPLNNYPRDWLRAPPQLFRKT